MANHKDARSRKDKTYYERQAAVTVKNKVRRLTKRAKNLKARKGTCPAGVDHAQRFERRKLMRVSGMRKPWTAEGLVEQTAHRAELAAVRAQKQHRHLHSSPSHTVTE